jgi:hydrogenase maturation factor
MCLAVPGKVKKIEGRKAEVEYPPSPEATEGQVQVGEGDPTSLRLRGARIREALVGEENVKVGDWVMVQMGIVVRVLKESEAKEMLEGWGVG